MEDEYGQCLAPSDGWTIYEPTYTPDPISSSITLRDIFGGVKEATSFALGVQKEMATVAGAADQTAYQKFMQSLALDNSKTLATTQARIAEANAAAELAKAQGKSVPVSIPTSGSKSTDTIILIGAIVGVIGVVYQISKGK